MTPRGDRVRVTVASATRRADLVLPSAVPVAELLPELARSVGLLDGPGLPAGLRLFGLDGRELASGAGLAAQHVVDGAVLAITDSPSGAAPRRYDDRAEAMSDIVSAILVPWSPSLGRLATLTALAVAVCLGAASLLVRPPTAVSLVAGWAVAAAVLAGAVVLSRARGDTEAAVALAALGCLAASVTAAAPFWHGGPVDRPLLAAGGTALVAGVLLGAGLRQARAFALVPVVVGASLVGTGVLAGRLGWQSADVLMVVMTLVLLGDPGFPAFALAVTGMSVDPLPGGRGDAAQVSPIDVEELRHDVRLAGQLMLSLHAALGGIVVLAAPFAVSTGLAGTLLATSACSVVLLRARRQHARGEVAVSLMSGLIGMATVAAAVLWLHPSWRPVVTLTAATAALAVLGLVLLPRARSVAASRIGDLAENAVTVSLLPVLAVACGLLDVVSSR